MYKLNSTQCANDLVIICNPIFKKYNINAFSYSRIYQDGSRAELWTDPYAMEYSFLEKKYLQGIYTPALLGKDKVMLYEHKILNYPAMVKEKLMHQLHDQAEIFNHANALLLADVHDNFSEYFFIYTPKSDRNAINTYLSNLEEIEKFCFAYFKKRAKDLIVEADAKKLIKPWAENKYSSAKPICNIEFQKRLTRKEMVVGYMLIEGKSAREISEIFNISKRTVENHIYNMKEKLNCSRKSKLIEALMKLSYKINFKRK
jgi:LuxR family transcriptional regulator, quorum-sensing system regulator SolR